MKHMFIKILRNGDSVMTFTGEQLMIRRANGEVDIFRMLMDDGILRIDLDNRVTITYGDGTIELEASETSKSDGKKKGKGRGGDKKDEVITGSF